MDLKKRRDHAKKRQSVLAQFTRHLRASCIWTVVVGVLLLASTLLRRQQEDSSVGTAMAPAAGPDLASCRRRYGNLTFLDPALIDRTKEASIPPLLLSYPGSGNTYFRAVLEYATSLHSGSIYISDKELNFAFAGEQTCGLECGAAIKAHPTDLRIMPEVDIWNRPSLKGDKRERLRPLSRWIRKKCVRGGVKFWTRIIFLAREPFAAILSDFQRLVSNSHTGSLSSDSILGDGRKVGDVWQERSLIAAKEYEASMSQVVFPLLKWDKNKPSKFPNLDVVTHVVKFEDIVLNKEKRVGELSALMKIMYPQLEAPREKLECAFVLADHKEGIVRAAKRLTATQVYKDIDSKLPCKMWNSIQNFARNFSYSASPNPNYKSIDSLCGV